MKNLRYALFLPVILLLTCSYTKAQNAACTNPPNGMVAWWTGDNTTEDSFGLSSGLNSSPVTFATGEVGAAFSFDNLIYTYLQIPDTAELESSSLAISIDAWVQANGSPGAFRYIFSKGASDEDFASYALYTGSGGGAVFYLHPAGSNYVLSSSATPSSIWDNRWHLLAGTYDGVAIHLYMDGQEILPATSAQNLVIGYNLPSTNDAFIGNYNPTVAHSVPFNFVGQIDEVELFNRALTLAEIQALYNAGPAGKCKNVIPIYTAALSKGYWQNKNGQGVVLGDASISGVCNSGTWLRQFPPFQDLSSTATCGQVANYVSKVTGAASGGSSMNAKLKAQMLSTALDTYFSDPGLGGNQLGAPTPIGGISINLVGYGGSFVGPRGTTIMQMLIYAGSQSDVGGSIWYGNVTSVQEPAKNAFEAINTGTAFAP